MQTEQWNRIDSPEINPHNHSQMILDKEAKTIPQKKKTTFSTNSCGKTRYPHEKEQVVPLPYTIYKN